MPFTPATILDNLDTVAVVSGGIFAGVAFHLSFSEAPALREFGLNEHWRFFPYMYKRSAISQPILTVVAGIAAVVHGTRIVGAPFYRNLWIASGVTFLAVVPYTIGVLVPINEAIINDNKMVKSGQESTVNVATKKELLDKWAALHLVRTVATVAGFSAMVFGLTRHSSLIYSW